jgi:hypothetical protein
LEKSMSKITMKNDVQVVLGSFDNINHLIKTWRLITKFLNVFSQHLKICEINKNCHDPSATFHGGWMGV